MDRERAERVVRSHYAGALVSDEELDLALGLDRVDYDRAHDEEEEAETAHPGESVVHVATPFDRCRDFFATSRPTKDDVVFDLGCGVGRVVLYGALVCEARFVGVELVAGRAAVAADRARRLGLNRVEIVAGSALEIDVSRGTIFFLFRPFSPPVEREMLARLHALGRERAITLGAHRLLPNALDPEVFEGGGTGDLRIVRSRARGRAP